MGFADELGSGMRKSYKYTLLYSGAEPVFTEDGDVFRITIPLCETATVSAGPIEKTRKNVIFNDVEIKLTVDEINELLLFCNEPRTGEEIRKKYGTCSKEYFRQLILKPMVEAGLLLLTIPDKPKSPNQRYRSR